MLRHKRILAGSLTVLLAAILGSACEDDENGPVAPDPPDPGSIQVTVATTGDDADADGYLLAVDGGQPRSVAANGSVTFSDLEPGSRQVSLSGLAENCSLTGDNPRAVTVVSEQTAQVTFAASCAALRQPVIAFNSDRAGGAFDIFVMNPDGSNPVNLTNHPALDLGPVLSPDGSRILFTSDRDDPGFSDLYVMEVDGTNVIRLTNTPGVFEAAHSGAWSPDASRIVFSSDQDDPNAGDPDRERFLREIYVMNADGSGVVRLTNDPADDLFPAWSPDGTRIAFTSDRTNARGNRDILLMNADGSGVARLTTDPDSASYANDGPAWSPDESKIAFRRSVFDPSIEDFTVEIAVINANGSGLTVLTSNLAFDRSPVFSPDGTQIAFGSDRGGDEEIYVMTASGSGVTNLTNDPAFDGRASWR